MKYIIFLIFSALLFSFCSCGNADGTPSRFSPKPTSYGSMNELVLISDEDIWEGSVGDTFEFYFASAYPVLPQPESTFDIRHFSAGELAADRLRKQLRNYVILADLEQDDSPTTLLLKKDIGEEKLRKAKEDKGFGTTVAKEKWAKDQNIFYLYGYGEQALIDAVKRSFPAIKKRIYEGDQNKRQATAYLAGDNKLVEQEILTTLGVEMRVPGDYYMALNKDNTIWLRHETDATSSNILLHKVPYTNAEQLTKESLKAMRDSIGRYVSSQVENTYMRVNDEDLPLIVTNTEMNGNYALEARGIWELENDYMGGAFVSYLILNKAKTEILLADGFLHAPGKKKRNFIQYIEEVLSSVQFANPPG